MVILRAPYWYIKRSHALIETVHFLACSLAYNLAAAGAARTLLEGHCGTLPVSMVQRYSQLKRAQTLLPAAVREVHGAALLQRHHVEELEGPAMLQALAQVRS